MYALIVSIITLALAVIAALSQAFAASTLWGWFIVPTFNAPMIGTMLMWGVGLTITMIRLKYITFTEMEAIIKLSSDEQVRVRATAYLTHIILSFTVLGVGWIVKLFV